MSTRKSEKIRLRDYIALEKEQMLPLNFNFSFIITPLYIVFALILVMMFGSFVGQGLAAQSVVALGLLAALTVAFVAGIPLVRRAAIRSELKRYDFDTSKVESHKIWDFSDEELSVQFNRHGIMLDGELHYYNHIRKPVLTSNDNKRVRIFLCFSPSNENSILLTVNPKTLKMLEDLGVEMDNQAVLDYIIENPGKAFAEIYDTGEISQSKA